MKVVDKDEVMLHSVKDIHRQFNFINRMQKRKKGEDEVSQGTIHESRTTSYLQHKKTSDDCNTVHKKVISGDEILENYFMRCMDFKIATDYVESSKFKIGGLEDKNAVEH